MLGISESAVYQHSPPQPVELAKVEDEFGWYRPIPFFPPDLPKLQLKPLAADQLAYVFDEQARILFPVAAA